MSRNHQIHFWTLTGGPSNIFARLCRIGLPEYKQLWGKQLSNYKKTSYHWSIVIVFPIIIDLKNYHNSIACLKLYSNESSQDKNHE